MQDTKRFCILFFKDFGDFTCTTLIIKEIVATKIEF